MKKLLYILCAAALAAGCSDDDASSYYLDELVIDTANCLAEGSYVQGVEANDLCRIKIPYENARGGTARISAPETNGLRIDTQEVTLVSGAGEATVAVKGTPLLLETSFLQLNVEYRAKTYLSSVEIAVLEDVDPSGTIEFEIDRQRRLRRRHHHREECLYGKRQRRKRCGRHRRRMLFGPRLLCRRLGAGDQRVVFQYGCCGRNLGCRQG